MLAIDPGTEESGYVLYDGESLLGFGVKRNETLLGMLKLGNMHFKGANHLAIEMVASYGMPVGRETFETVFWTGRFVQASRLPFTRIYRKDVKLHLCNSVRAKDSNVAQALKDLHGGSNAKGKKSNPGPLYGIKSHCWAALGVARTYLDTRSTQRVV